MNENLKSLVSKFIELGGMSKNVIVRNAINTDNYENKFIVDFIKKFVQEKEAENQKKLSEKKPIITEEELIDLQIEAERDERGRFKLPEKLLEIEKEAKLKYAKIMFLYQKLVSTCLGNTENLEIIRHREMLKRIDSGEFFNCHYLSKKGETIFLESCQIYYPKELGTFKSKRKIDFKHNTFKNRIIKTENPKYPTIEITTEFLISFNGLTIINIT